MANEEVKKKAPKGKRYTQDEILKVLKEIEGGASIASVARANGVTDQTLYWWREKYGGMESGELKELRALQTDARSTRKRASFRLKAFKLPLESDQVST